MCCYTPFATQCLALRRWRYRPTFPDTSAAYKNIDSKILLKQSFELIKAAGYKVNNLDTMLCLQAPKIKPFIPLMQETIAGILCIETGDVSIKATTTERMGFVGREEG